MKLFKRVAAFVLAVVVAGLLAAPSIAKADNVAVKLDPSVSVAWLNDKTADDGNYQVQILIKDALGDKYALTDVYGIEITFKNVDLSGGAGGFFVFQAPSNNWWTNDNLKYCCNFSNDDSKDVKLVAVEGTNDLKMKKLGTEPVFAASDDNAVAVVRQWWGVAMSVSRVDILGKDGAVLVSSYVAPVAPQPQPSQSFLLSEAAVLENLADGIQYKEMMLNGVKVSDTCIGLKPAEGTTAKVTLTVNVDKAGTYDLEVVYNAKGDNRPMSLKVNDEAAQDVALASTSSENYTDCGVKKLSVKLNAGANTIVFSQASNYDNSTVKTPNLVSVKVTAQGGQPVTGVSYAPIIVCGAAVLVCAAAVVVSAKKKEN